MTAFKERDSLLVERFVASFEKLDELTAWDSDPVACQLAVGHPDQFGFKRWRPAKVDTELELLEPLYYQIARSLPASFRASRSFLSVG